eukprot:8427709-Alexandrium_andersonii.AAC.1
MSASLVGSEMCIRDRQERWMEREREVGRGREREREGETRRDRDRQGESCLLYTSDAADDM